MSRCHTVMMIQVCLLSHTVFCDLISMFWIAFLLFSHVLLLMFKTEAKIVFLIVQRPQFYFLKIIFVTEKS